MAFFGTASQSMRPLLLLNLLMKDKSLTMKIFLFQSKMSNFVNACEAYNIRKEAKLSNLKNHLVKKTRRDLQQSNGHVSAFLSKNFDIISNIKFYFRSSTKTQLLLFSNETGFKQNGHIYHWQRSFMQSCPSRHHIWVRRGYSVH